MLKITPITVSFFGYFLSTSDICFFFSDVLSLLASLSWYICESVQRSFKTKHHTDSHWWLLNQGFDKALTNFKLASSKLCVTIRNIAPCNKKCQGPATKSIYCTSPLATSLTCSKLAHWPRTNIAKHQVMTIKAICGSDNTKYKFSTHKNSEWELICTDQMTYVQDWDLLI